MSTTAPEAVEIDRAELVKLALDLCNIDSPAGREGEAGEFVYQWLRENGFEARRIGMFPDRFNVLGRLPGGGGGYSLIFNSHLDTSHNQTDTWSMRDAAADIHHSAWLEDGVLYGEGIVNDKGPMAAFMIAAKALKEAGAPLKGDLLLSAVPGEIGYEPIDEFAAPEYLSKEVGTRYLIQHGGVADFALNAEGTDFKWASVEAGKAFFKLVVHGATQIYTPFVPDVEVSPTHPNAIVRAALLIPKLEEWGREYTRRFTWTGLDGTVAPKVVIGAIRAGNPYHVTRTSELCALYVDVRLVPDQDPLAVKDELVELLDTTGIEGDVELFVYRRSYPAGEKVTPLLESLRRAHDSVHDFELELAPPYISSMWRDLSIFNEMGIPSITYGPPRRFESLSMTVDDLVATAEVYAALAADLCGRDKPRGR